MKSLRSFIVFLFLSVNKHLKEAEDYPIKRIIIEFSLLAVATKIFFLIGFLILIILVLLILFPLSLISQNIDLSNVTFPEQYHPAIKAVSSGGSGAILTILEGITVVPLRETLIWQVIPIFIGLKFTKDRKKLILISAIFFSLVHINPLRIILVFPLGLILAWVYILLIKRSFWKAFTATALIHGFYNLVTFVSVKLIGV